MDFTLQHTAELVSLALTIPTVILAGVVVKVWGPAIKHKPVLANDWFILGVVIGFVGAFLDNLYWAIPWTAKTLDLEIADELWTGGVYFNIFFRQGMGILAAYCHLRAATIHSNRTISGLNSLLVASNLLGVIYSILLMFIYIKG